MTVPRVCIPPGETVPSVHRSGVQSDPRCRGDSQRREQFRCPATGDRGVQKPAVCSRTVTGCDVQCAPCSNAGETQKLHSEGSPVPEHQTAEHPFRGLRTSPAERHPARSRQTGKPDTTEKREKDKQTIPHTDNRGVGRGPGRAHTDEVHGTADVNVLQRC